MEIPPLNTEYDEGYFDKDEQGWVTNKTMVIMNSAGVVKVRRWGDANGRDPYDTTTETRALAYFPELKLVKLERWPWYFDVEKDRLVDADRFDSLVRRPTTRECVSTERVQGALLIAFQLLPLLGGPPLPHPHFPGWPARAANAGTYEFTKLEQPLPTECHLTLSWRPAIDAKSTPELGLLLKAPRACVGLTVTEKGELCISAYGPYELRPAAKAAAEAWDW